MGKRKSLLKMGITLKLLACFPKFTFDFPIPKKSHLNRHRGISPVLSLLNNNNYYII